MVEKSQGDFRFPFFLLVEKYNKTKGANETYKQMATVIWEWNSDGKH